jgi:hypothetical protein
MKTDKRKAARRKCSAIANLTCEGNNHESFYTIKIIDHSASGMRISSMDPVDCSELLTIVMDSNRGETCFPAEFVWMQKNADRYVIGLRKV